MSTSNGPHLSRSQRELLALQQKIAVYEQMRNEYCALMHYLIETHDGEFDIEADRMKVLADAGHLKKGVRTEFLTRTSDGKRVMRMTRIEPEASDERRIIIP